VTTQINKPSRANTIAKDQMVIQGVQKDLNTMSNLLLGASTYTPASLTALVQSRIDAANAVATAKAAWQHAAATYDAVNQQVGVVVHDLKQFVIGAFGTTSPKLADFGFVPRTVTPLTVEQKAAAAAKRAATRKARGTVGPKKKLEITGTVPATASATTAPSAAPSNATPTTTQATTPPATGAPAAKS
jgi:hypothetical protein